MGTWLTSDLHIGHKKITDDRGYKDPDFHDSAIARTWRRMVKEDDFVWVLGDISAGGNTAQSEALQFFSELPGRKFLVAGNHDSVHPMYGTAARRWDADYRTAFEYVCSQAILNVEGIKLMLSHFPYTADHTPNQRYTEWRLRDTGRWLAHGHTHDRLAWRPEFPREYHVGWDAHKKLVALGEVASFIKSKKLLNGREHYVSQA